MTPATRRSSGHRARPRTMVAAAALACGSLLVGYMPIGLPLVLSEDGRVSITRAHAYAGLLTLGLAILGPLIVRLASAPKSLSERRQEGRFVCECHVVGIATLILLVASLNLAGPPTGGPAASDQATAEAGR